MPWLKKATARKVPVNHKENCRNAQSATRMAPTSMATPVHQRSGTSGRKPKLNDPKLNDQGRFKNLLNNRFTRKEKACSHSRRCVVLIRHRALCARCSHLKLVLASSPARRTCAAADHHRNPLAGIHRPRWPLPIHVPFIQGLCP